MASPCVYTYIGQAMPPLSTRTPCGWLISAARFQRQLGQLQGLCREPVSCCFMRGTEWVVNLKIVGLSPLCSDCCLSEIAKHGQGSVYHISRFPPVIDTNSRCPGFLLRMADMAQYHFLYTRLSQTLCVFKPWLTFFFKTCWSHWRLYTLWCHLAQGVFIRVECCLWNCHRWYKSNFAFL